jgi:hypothetical protein
MTAAELPPIPVIDAGADFPLQTLAAEAARAHLLMDIATKGVPRLALRTLDAVSRRWLVRHGNAYLDEIDRVAAKLGRPGAYYLAINYEWGCTVSVRPGADGAAPLLTRTLDWGIAGIGRHIIAARVASPAGPFTAMTWPGFTGVMQGMAPGRFSIAINQAPMRRLGGGMLVTDWAANRARVWDMPHQLAAHLLRRVFGTAADYDAAFTMLRDEPIAAPATFTLAGVKPHQTCVIERLETQAHVIDGPSGATNHWRGLDHGARSRGLDSEGRLAAMMAAGAQDMSPSFPWLAPPILNPTTRLVMMADAAAGRLIAQGWEEMSPVTAVLDLSQARAELVKA